VLNTMTVCSGPVVDSELGVGVGVSVIKTAGDELLAVEVVEEVDGMDGRERVFEGGGRVEKV